MAVYFFKKLTLIGVLNVQRCKNNIWYKIHNNGVVADLTLEIMNTVHGYTTRL